MDEVTSSKDSSQNTKKRGKFSGRIGYVLAVAGSAVGLGNIWRFPYLAAKYGGGIFLLIYLILVVTFGYVLIVSETALGRMTKKSPIGAFHAFGKRLPFHWRLDECDRSHADRAILLRDRRLGAQVSV